MTKPEPYPPEYDSLQAFRVQYLQMVAKYWSSPSLLPKEVKDGLQWLANTCGEAKVPWSIDLTFHFDQECGPEWKPMAGYGRLGWVLSNQAKFTIYLPVERLREVGSERPLALAMFMRQHGSLLPDEDPEPSAERTARDQAPDAYPQGRLMQHSSPASLPTMTEFREFDGVCARVLALAAADRSFYHDIIRKPSGHVKDRLSDLLQYDVPWCMDLTFEEDRNATWECQKWCSLQPNALELYVPQKPKDPQDETKDATPPVQTIALAAYNETGADHPLTCP